MRGHVKAIAVAIGLALGVVLGVTSVGSGALVGLAKRGLKGLPTLAIKTPDDLDAARAFIDEHAA